MYYKANQHKTTNSDELGDYDADIHHGDYVADLKFVLRQSDQLDQKVMELHQKREPAQDAHIVIDEFMSIARELETYGVDPHPVKVWVTIHILVGAVQSVNY